MIDDPDDNFGNDSETAYFCDGAYLCASAAGLFGGSGSNISYLGVFRFNDPASYTNPHIGYCLIYL